jgi:hypothetical protein
MKLKIQLTLASLVIAFMALAPSAAHASTPGIGHTHSHMFHDHAPHIHQHGSHLHHGQPS